MTSPTSAGNYCFPCMVCSSQAYYVRSNIQLCKWHFDEVTEEAQKAERERILELIKEWDRENKYGDGINIYKEWARTESFYKRYLILLGRLSKADDEVWK